MNLNFKTLIKDMVNEYNGRIESIDSLLEQVKDAKALLKSSLKNNLSYLEIEENIKILKNNKKDISEQISNLQEQLDDIKENSDGFSELKESSEELNEKEGDIEAELGDKYTDKLSKAGLPLIISITKKGKVKVSLM